MGTFYVFPPPSGTAGDPDLSDWALRVTQGGDVDIKDDLEVSDDLTVGGSGTVGGANITSDLRLKSNIIESTYGINEIMRLSPKIYDKYKSPNKENLITKEIGFIAQEVVELIPEMVSLPEDDDDLYGLYYDMLIPVLTKAIQEQQTIIDDLKQKTKETESKYDTLLKEIELIKIRIESRE